MASNLLSSSSSQINTVQNDFKFESRPCQVELLDQLGTDLTVVNSARISYGAESKELTKRDVGLMNYLAKHKHFSPFRHCMIQFRLQMPEFVARQMYKHVVGIETTSTHPTKDHAWNEISGRYKILKSIYIPKTWKSQHENSKQCSGDPLNDEQQQQASELYKSVVKNIMDTYKNLLKIGVSKEQARTVLPLSFMTECVWTASLQAVYNFIVLRNDPHAQYEIQILAQEIEKIVVDKFPVAYRALQKTLQ